MPPSSRTRQKLCWYFIGSHYYVLWVHLSREPGVILAMVLASRRHRIREWYLMGAVERLLSSQVLGFQAPTIPELIAGRATRRPVSERGLGHAWEFRSPPQRLDEELLVSLLSSTGGSPSWLGERGLDSDKCGRRDLNPGVCSDCSNYQRGRPTHGGV